MIKKLVAGAVGGPGVSTGQDVAEVVNNISNNIRTVSKNSPIINQILSASDAQTVTGSVTYTYGIAPNGKPGVKCQFSGSVAIKLPTATGLQFDGEACLYLIGGKSTNLDSVTFRVYQNFAGNQQNFRQLVFATNPVNNFREQGGAISFYCNPLSFGTSGAPAASYKIDDMRLTAVATSSTVGELWLLGYAVAYKKRKSRICITIDDGYASAVTVGYPMFARAGIPTTIGVVPSAVDAGLAGYATIAQLRSYVGAGNAIVAHDVGSLTADYASANLAADSVKGAIGWIVDNGLGVANFDQCYIWPQGSFQVSSGDTSFLDAILSIGINISRATNPFSQANQGNYDGLSKYNRLALPVIGHSFAGTTAAEATNISNIVSYINAISAQTGIDVTLILHKIVPNSTADGDMILSIRESDLQTIINAIKANIDAGNLEAVTMPQLSAALDNSINSM